MAKLAALMPFGKVAMFLDEVLPTAAQTHASTIRNYTQRVGQGLERHHDTLPAAIPRAPAGEVVLGLDGGYVRGRQPRPERTFEIVVGKVLNDQSPATRLAQALVAPGVCHVALSLVPCVRMRQEAGIDERDDGGAVRAAGREAARHREALQR